MKIASKTDNTIEEYDSGIYDERGPCGSTSRTSIESNMLHHGLVKPNRQRGTKKDKTKRVFVGSPCGTSCSRASPAVATGILDVQAEGMKTNANHIADMQKLKDKRNMHEAGSKTTCDGDSP